MCYTLHISMSMCIIQHMKTKQLGITCRFIITQDGTNNADSENFHATLQTVPRYGEMVHFKGEWFHVIGVYHYLDDKNPHDQWYLNTVTILVSRDNPVDIIRAKIRP